LLTDFSPPRHLKRSKREDFPLHYLKFFLYIFSLFVPLLASKRQFLTKTESKPLPVQREVFSKNLSSFRDVSKMPEVMKFKKEGSKIYHFNDQ